MDPKNPKLDENGHGEVSAFSEEEWEEFMDLVASEEQVEYNLLVDLNDVHDDSFDDLGY